MFLLRDKDILFLGEREREILRNYLGLNCDIGKELGKGLGSFWDLGNSLGRIGIRKGIRKLSLGRGLGF